jgi:hypothetical protein
VMLFNLAITGWIHEWPLFRASALIAILTLGISFWRYGFSQSPAVRKSDRVIA